MFCYLSFLCIWLITIKWSSPLYSRESRDSQHLAVSAQRRTRTLKVGQKHPHPDERLTFGLCSSIHHVSPTLRASFVCYEMLCTLNSARWCWYSHGNWRCSCSRKRYIRRQRNWQRVQSLQLNESADLSGLWKGSRNRSSCTISKCVNSYKVRLGAARNMTWQRTCQKQRIVSVQAPL